MGLFGVSPAIKKKNHTCQQLGATFCSQQHLGQVCDETAVFPSQMGAHLPASSALILELQVRKLSTDVTEVYFLI